MRSHSPVEEAEHDDHVLAVVGEHLGELGAAGRDCAADDVPGEPVLGAAVGGGVEGEIDALADAAALPPVEGGERVHRAEAAGDVRRLVHLGGNGRRVPGAVVKLGVAGGHHLPAHGKGDEVVRLEVGTGAFEAEVGDGEGR